MAFVFFFVETLQKHISLTLLFLGGSDDCTNRAFHCARMRMLFPDLLVVQGVSGGISDCYQSWSHALCAVVYHQKHMELTPGTGFTRCKRCNSACK